MKFEPWHSLLSTGACWSCWSSRFPRISRSQGLFYVWLSEYSRVIYHHSVHKLFTLSACLYSNQNIIKVCLSHLSCVRLIRNVTSHVLTVNIYWWLCLSVKILLCPIREKLDLLEIVELKDNRDPGERLVVRDLLDLPEHRFVHHRYYPPELFAYTCTL